MVADGDQPTYILAWLATLSFATQMPGSQARVADDHMHFAHIGLVYCIQRLFCFWHHLRCSAFLQHLEPSGTATLL